MIRTVVKWSYLKGNNGLARAKAHVNYIQYRDGTDRELGPRRFFNATEEGIRGGGIRHRLDELDQRGVQIHKLIMSPGLNCVDTQNYVREVMENLGQKKGLELEWYAVEHRNTEHLHAHVVVMGTDLNGRKVQFDPSDSIGLRKWGDHYLEREHRLERYLDGELKRLLSEGTCSRELDYKRGNGDKDFERWMYGDEKERKRAKTSSDAHSEWDMFDKDQRRNFEVERFANRPMTYNQYRIESAGRLSSFHERYQDLQLRGYWKDIAENFPELAHDAKIELEWLDTLAAERNNEKIDLDRLMDGLKPEERFVREFVTREVEHLERDGVLNEQSKTLWRDSFLLVEEQSEIRSPFERLYGDPSRERGYEHDER